MLSDKIEQFFADVAAGDLASLLALVCFSGVYLCVTVALLIQLKGREGSLSKKLFWGLVLTIPVLGWLFYLAFYQVPPSQQFR